jgi:hypothetical protein
MNFENKDTKDTLRYAFLMIILPIIISTFLSNQITASDWLYRHSVWISQYLKGDFSPILQYPPLFHWMMLPFVAINFPVKYFQIIFIILSTLGILYFVYKKESEETLKNTAILLMTSIPYILFSGALMPQGLDYLFFPLAVIFYYQNRVKSSVAMIMLDFLMHPIGMLFAGILFLHSLLTKRYKFAKIFLIIILIFLPIFYYYSFVSSQLVGLSWNYQAQNEWESQFINPLWKFFALTGLLTWTYLPVALWKLKKKKFKLTETQLLYAIWIITFFLFIPFNLGIFRMMSYIILPMSIFVASLIESFSIKEMIQKLFKKRINDKNEIEKRFNDAFGEEK